MGLIPAGPGFREVQTAIKEYRRKHRQSREIHLGMKYISMETFLSVTTGEEFVLRDCTN